MIESLVIFQWGSFSEGVTFWNSLALVMTLQHSWMCMCVPYFILLTTVCWLLSLCFSNTYWYFTVWRHHGEVYFSWCWQPKLTLVVVVFLVFVNLRKTHNLLDCGFYKNKIICLWFSCFIATHWGLYYVVVSASHSCTTNGNPLSSFLRKD